VPPQVRLPVLVQELPVLVAVPLQAQVPVPLQAQVPRQAFR